MQRKPLSLLKARMEARTPGITARVPEILRELDAAEEQPLALAPIRHHANCTQAEVAERLGVSQPEISQLEQRADTSVSTLRRYAAALGGELRVGVVLDGQWLSVLPTKQSEG